MRFLLLVLAGIAAGFPALAENRAVVIGNANYRTAPDLAGSDTLALATVMRNAGFATAQGVDQTAADLRRTLDLLARADAQPGARIVSLSGRFINGAGETWFMGAEAQQPSLLVAGTQGVPLSLIVQLMSGGKPGAVLLLGTDKQDMPHQPGLESGIGALSVAPGVSVIIGAPEGTARALRELAAGHSVAKALSAAPGMVLLEGGDPTLVPVVPGARPAPPAENPIDADSTAWAEAAARDVVASYGAYLSRYPAGLYSAAARERQRQLQARVDALNADRDAWAAAALANNIATYDRYVQRFPKGRYVTAARSRLAELRQALVPKPTPPRPVVQPPKPPTPEAIESGMRLDRGARMWVQVALSRLGFDPGPPDGAFGTRTRNVLRNWQHNSNLLQSGYLNPAQHAIMQRQIAYLDGDNGKRDRAYWLQTGAKGGPADLRTYLKRYPNGRYAADARRQLNNPTVGPILDPQLRGDAATWRWARSQDTAASYDAYLERFPNGDHAAEARERRANMRAATEAARREEDALGLSDRTRRAIEERLSIIGMRPGRVDGEFTGETRQALRRYQASRNQRVTGYVSRQTVNSLLEGIALPR